jgi:bifunctional UDP-N-acetylglucosamine pyrophosphorylase / glucosamine-1-phosphate N-acetyltransferase
MAGGLGTRMRSELPKHLHPILGRRMVDWVLAAAAEVDAEPVVVVASPGTAELFEGVEVAVQERPLGTGDAVRWARDAIEGRVADVLVLSGDTPLLTGALLRDLVAAHRGAGAAATILSAEPSDPRLYGRVIRDPDGRIVRIAEGTDATAEELAVREVNTSIYAFRGDALWPTLDRLEPRNVQGELYLTDAIGVLVTDGAEVTAYIAPNPVETDGVNTRGELAAAAAALRDRINAAHMEAGVTIVDPATAWIEPTVAIEPVVRSGAEIHPHTVAIDADIGQAATVGPFCYLRPGAVLGRRTKAGTFVEIKNSRLEEGAKVPHLSYIGDADIGAGTNIAAGNITANFPHQPGRAKGRTTIGRDVRTGIHNGFVAPVTIGDGAWVAAGSVITKDVPPGALAVARARQVNREDYVERHGNG